MAKLFIITSNHLRHRFFVNTLGEKHKIVGIASEKKGHISQNGC